MNSDEIKTYLKNKLAEEHDTTADKVVITGFRGGVSNIKIYNNDEEIPSYNPNT